MSKRYCDAFFAFTCGAAIAVVVLARMFNIPELAQAALPFALAAGAFRLGSWAIDKTEQR